MITASQAGWNTDLSTFSRFGLPAVRSAGVEPAILPPFWAQVVSEVNRLSGSSMPASGRVERQKQAQAGRWLVFELEVAESIDFFAGDHIISGRQRTGPAGCAGASPRLATCPTKLSMGDPGSCSKRQIQKR